MDSESWATGSTAESSNASCKGVKRMSRLKALQLSETLSLTSQKSYEDELLSFCIGALKKDKSLQWSVKALIDSRQQERDSMNRPLNRSIKFYWGPNSSSSLSNSLVQRIVVEMSGVTVYADKSKALTCQRLMAYALRLKRHQQLPATKMTALQIMKHCIIQYDTVGRLLTRVQLPEDGHVDWSTQVGWYCLVVPEQPDQPITHIMHVRSNSIKLLPAEYHCAQDEAGKRVFLDQCWFEDLAKVCNDRGDSKQLSRELFIQEVLQPYVAPAYITTPTTSSSSLAKASRRVKRKGGLVASMLKKQRQRLITTTITTAPSLQTPVQGPPGSGSGSEAHEPAPEAPPGDGASEDITEPI